MKKQSFFINKQDGFFLPYVLFITAIVLLVVSLGTHAYKNDIYIVHNHFEQLKIETIVQMGREQFKREVSEHTAKKGHVSYVFPQGSAEITYTRMDDTEYTLLFTVSTDDKSYINTNTFFLEKDGQEKPTKEKDAEKENKQQKTSHTNSMHPKRVDNS
jgi:major membrane immunogen (membrane-anchored lipoprotein)